METKVCIPYILLSPVKWTIVLSVTKCCLTQRHVRNKSEEGGEGEKEAEKERERDRKEKQRGREWMEEQNYERMREEEKTGEKDWEREREREINRKERKIKKETCTRRGLESADQSVLLHRSYRPCLIEIRILYISIIYIYIYKYLIYIYKYIVH